MNEIKIEKSILKKSVLRGSHFENSILADTIFDNCDLKKCIFNNAKFDSISFNSTDLFMSKFEHNIYKETMIKIMQYNVCEI